MGGAGTPYAFEVEGLELGVYGVCVESIAALTPTVAFQRLEGRTGVLEQGSGMETVEDVKVMPLGNVVGVVEHCAL